MEKPIRNNNNDVENDNDNDNDNDTDTDDDNNEGPMIIWNFLGKKNCQLLEASVFSSWRVPRSVPKKSQRFPKYTVL